MAAGTLRGANTTFDNVYGGSNQGGLWTTAHDDVTASAASAGVVKQPLSNTSANVHAVRVPPGSTRFQMRVKHTGTTAVVTSPVVTVYGIYNDSGQPNSSGWFDDSATSNEIQRLASAVTLTCATTDILVNLSQYSACPVNSIDSNPWYDCLGAKFIVALVSTAASLTDCTSATLQVQFLS